MLWSRLHIQHFVYKSYSLASWISCLVPSLFLLSWAPGYAHPQSRSFYTLFTFGIIGACRPGLFRIMRTHITRTRHKDMWSSAFSICMHRCRYCIDKICFVHQMRHSQVLPGCPHSSTGALCLVSLIWEKIPGLHGCHVLIPEHRSLGMRLGATFLRVQLPCGSHHCHSCHCVDL